MNSYVTAIYVRVSTTKDSQKDSPEHQKGLCEEMARGLDLDVQYVYEDRDTGTSIVAREEIQKLILHAKNKYFRTVIFASLSRFSRDTLDSLNLKRILVDALGVRVISIEEGYDSFKDNDELKFQIISAVNQKLSEQISLSSKRGIRQSALKGNYTGSITPYGYQKVNLGDKKTLIPDEETKQVVQLIFDLYTAMKMGEKAIVHDLNTVRKIPSAKGGKWGITSVQRILTNEVYTGANVFCKYEVKKVYNDITNMTDRSKKQVQREKAKWERTPTKTHEAIISDEVFQLAQEIRLERGGGSRGGVRNKVNVFAGMVFCKHCGASLVSCKSKRSTVKADGREYRYLICSRRRRQGDSGCSNNLWLPYYDFRDNVLSEISRKLQETLDIEYIAQNSMGKLVSINTGHKEKEQKKLEKSIESNRKLLFELRKQKMLGEIDEEQYLYEKAMYEKKINSLQAKLEKATEMAEEEANMEKLHADIRTALIQLSELDYDLMEEMRLVLSKLVEKITISRDGEVEIFTPLLGAQVVE